MFSDQRPCNCRLAIAEYEQYKMDIPERLLQKLQNDSGLYGGVLQSITEFKPWFDHSKTPFFPEYTDHNWTHVAQTMATASSLIRDDAWVTVTPTDAAVLVLATALHDCGMHLSEDGFLALLNDKDGEWCIQGWNDATWPALWSDFLGEASRFDARKLLAIFGDTKPIHPPQLDPKEWTLRDRLLIGEFLRRHHARLGHEIAVHGVPGVGTFQLRLKGIPPDLSDIAGLIARSHFPFRKCSVRFGNNQMDKVNLPIPGEDGPATYDNSVLHFERVSPGRFRIRLGNAAEITEWRRRSQRQGMKYELAGGREFGFYS